jgi:hypothetical protein
MSAFVIGALCVVCFVVGVLFGIALSLMGE